MPGSHLNLFGRMIVSNTFTRPLCTLCCLLPSGLWIGILFLVSMITSVLSNQTELHIGGFFPITATDGWQGGHVCEVAAQMALDDINANSYLLQGYELKMHWNDSQCEPGRGTRLLHQLIYNEPVKVFLLAGCSRVCTTVARAAKEWNLNVMCYGASSPALSNRNRFETLFRTHPSAIVHNPTRIKLMQTFGWSRVSILQQAEELFISTADDLEERCKSAGIEIVTKQTFLSDPSEAVRNLIRYDSRIVVGLFYVSAARRVLCEIYKHAAYGRAYAWFFLVWYQDKWYELSLEQERISCTADEMRKAAEGHLTTEAVTLNPGHHSMITIPGITVTKFKERLDEKLSTRGYNTSSGRHPEGYQEAPLAYDAVWAIALALNKTIENLSMNETKLEDFNYRNRLIRNEIFSALSTISFIGVSGRIAFTENGDRGHEALIQVEQMVNGEYVLLGYCDGQGLNFTWINKTIWKGNFPQDRTIIRVDLRKISLPLFVTMSTVASLGIFLAILLILFTYIYRNRKVIESSLRVTSVLLLTGLSLCFVSVFLFGLDGRFLHAEMLNCICIMRKWFLSIGFSLGYGAMFSKVWWAHHLKSKDLTSQQLNAQLWKPYLMVVTVVGIDIIFLAIWTLLDPLRRTVEIFELVRPDDIEDDSVIQPRLEHCESTHTNIWLGITYSFKGLLLVYGSVLAIQMRSIKVNSINDAHSVGWSICIITIFGVIEAPLTMSISFQQDALFALVAFAIILPSMVTMSFVYIPKINEIIREGDEDKSD